MLARTGNRGNRGNRARARSRTVTAPAFVLTANAAAAATVGADGADRRRVRRLPAALRLLQRHLAELEAFDARGGGQRLGASEVFSARDAWWRWDGIPDNEKFFFYHVLNRSLVPVNFLDLYNRHALPDKRVTFLGRTNGLLLPERHHPNCTCVCQV